MKKKTIMGLEYKYEVLVVYIVSLLGLIFSIMKDKKIDKDVKFQYNQSGTIFIISFALTIMSRTTYHLIGGFTISWIFSLVQLALFAFSIVVIVKAFNDETYEIPVISNITKMIWK